MIKMQRSVPAITEDEAKVIWQQAVDRESFLQQLRVRGCRKIESVRLLRNMAHISLDEAKQIVHFSKTWKDRLAVDDAFHDVAYDALDELEQTSSAIAS